MKYGVAATGAVLFLAGVSLLLASYGPVAAAQAVPSPVPAVELQPPPAPGSIVPDAATYQLLVNPGVEVYDPPYRQYQGVDCQVASGWQRFWDRDLPEPCWMDCRVFAASPLGGGWVERIEGETSQLVIGTEPYTAGIRQTVTGLTPGAGYGFHAAMLTIYQTSAPPDVDGTMIKQVGMDPTGGTDPAAPSVVWSEPDGNDEGPWSIDLRTAVLAQAPAMTVFARVISPYPAGASPFLNISFIDSAILALTPEVSASSPPVSQEPTFTVSWNNAVAAPGVVKLKWRDVQWLDEAEGVWHDWITRTYAVEAPFAGERGHAYRFRARIWQKYENGAHLYGPYRPEGDTRTVVVGSRVAGQVLTPEGYPVVGATVTMSGTAYAATSGAWGQYEMFCPPSLEPHTVAVGHPRWLSPPPVYGVTLGPTETATITWTLRPTGDAIANGQFEEGLDGWVARMQGASPAVVTEPVHTGHYALALGAGMAEGTTAVSQTVVLAGAWEPALSFWYDVAAPDADDEAFTVIVRVAPESTASDLPAATYVFTPSLETGGWRHQWYPVGLPQEYLAGTATVEFRVSREQDEAPMPIYLDEVSLGPTPGGPERAYLPLISR